MSHPKKRPRPIQPTAQTGRPGTGSRPTNGTGSRPSSSRPGVVKQPVARPGQNQSSVRTRVDRTLPPFSTQRYLVIWVAVVVLLVAVLLVLALRGTGNTASTAGAVATPPAANSSSGSTPGSSGSGSAASSGPGKYMVIDTAKGTIVARLHTESSAGVSKTIANFVDKANKGYFNGLTFHRVEDWVIQGGDPLGNGTGGGQMPSEYNQLPFKAGALGVARGGDPAINNDSQFFIVKTDADYLDGQYTNFGQVTEGMDVVSKIAIGDKINKITVEDRK